jgi:N-acetylglutamate synthase-like GNAT family acetyltransferase
MTTPTAQIREAARADAAELAAVIRAAWEPLAKQSGWTQSQLPRCPAFCQPDWITEGFDKGIRFFVAMVEAQAIGCVGMTAPKDGACELIRLAVLPDRTRKGIGATLVEHVICQARSLGLARVHLALLADRTALLQWYEKLGFTLERIEVPAHVPFKVAHMSRELATHDAVAPERKPQP